MKLLYVLLFGLFIPLTLQAQISLPQIPSDSASMQQSMSASVPASQVSDLKIIDLQVYLRPCDTSFCSSMLDNQPDPDSILHAHLSSTMGAAFAEIIVKVQDPNLVDQLHLKAGRSIGATHFIEKQTPFHTVANPPQGVTITLVNYDTLHIHIDRCLQALPFHLEAWLENSDGLLSPVKTFSIQ